MKGIASIRGEKLPRINQDYFYEVASFYPGTVIANDQDIKWKLFVQEESGRWRELRGTLKQGRRVSFKFPQQWYGKKLLVEAFLNNPEIKEPPGMVVMPVPGERSIKRISILDRNGRPFSQPPKYGQTIKVEIETVNMLGETLNVGLWERDTISATGHSAADNENIWGADKSYKVTESNGMVTLNFILDPGWAVKANRSLFEGSTHEYYLLVKGYGAGTKYSHQQEVTDAVATDQNNTTPQGSGAAARQPRLPQQAPQGAAGGQSPPAPVTPAPAPPQMPAANPAPAPVQGQATIPASGTGADPAPTAGGKSTTTVEEQNVEGLTDAYFAKKEFTKKTGEAATTLRYEIKSNGNRTATAEEKKKIAGIIMTKPEVKALTAKKEYTTEEAVIQALTKEVYNEKDIVTIPTFKLGPEFKKIQNAPLDEKVYLVAVGYLLEGKQATITIKEKDGIIKGAPDAALSIIEITEQQMDDPNAAVEGTEKTAFTGTIRDNMVRIPVQLRPKDDEALKQWKDKLAKGKQDGEYTYKFAGDMTIDNENEKKTIAANILKNAKGGLRGNTKIEAGKTAYVDEIEQLLAVKSYKKEETITFKLYKKIPELLYLRAQAQGEQQHDKEFLKKDGAYFEIGTGKCSCNRDLTELEFKEILKSLRTKEKLEINDIWKPRNAGGAHPSDTSLAATVNKFNEVMKKADITTCIRKVYFIAECYHETDRFYSTQEYDNSHTPNYDPYRGRGIIQLTHKEAYERYAYYKGDDTILSDYGQVATNLDLALDSAGWYWKQGKLLSVGDTWQPTTAAQTTFKLNARSYPKTNYDTKYTLANGATVKRYGSVDLNLVADNDDINVISYLINGGDNGLEERKKYLKELKEISFFKCDKNQSGWHDPVDNPVSTNYYQGGNIDGTSKNWGLFGDDIRKEAGRPHTGLDLFATTGTDIYACVDGTVHNRRWHSGYGNTITIKVNDPKAFMERKRTSYTHKTTREMEHGTSWSDSGDIYLFYAHLDSVKEFTFGEEVSCGDKLGTTGRSGVTAGTHAPHLHFEIFCSYRMGVGTDYRMNPAYFVAYKHYDDQSEAERTAQETEKNRGQIKEVDGSDKLSAIDLS